MKCMMLSSGFLGFCSCFSCSQYPHCFFEFLFRVCVGVFVLCSHCFCHLVQCHISAFFSFYSSTWKVSLLYPVLLSIFFPSLFLPVADWCTSPLFLAVCHHVISSQCMYTPTFLFVMASVFLPSCVPMVLHVFSSSLCSCLVFFVFCTIFQQPNKLLTFSYFSCLRLLPLGALHSKP